MTTKIKAYNDQQTETDKEICDLLALTIDNELTEAESKIWHAHPVWFLDGNPIVGYSKRKGCINLMFWSGRSFDEPGLARMGERVAASVQAAVEFAEQSELPDPAQVFEFMFADQRP